MAEQSTEPKVDTEGQAPATAEPAAEAPVKEPEAAAEKPGEDQAEGEAKSILEESEEDKDGEPEKPEAPEDYEFEYPEGVQVDEGALAEFKPLAKERGLSQEQAQKLVSMYANGVLKSSDAHLKAWNTQVNQWTADLKKDTEFGGANLKANSGLAVKALQHFGSPALRQYLDSTKLVNNPELFKMLVRIGRVVGEDKFLDGGGSGAQPDRAKVLYPNMK